MIYILLPVHNRITITEKFVDCLTHQTNQSFKLILIDDGSTDGTDKMVLKKLPSSEVLYGDGNLWWAGSLQIGYKWLCGKNIKDNDIILIINDDTEFDENFLEKAEKSLMGKENIILKAWCFDKFSKVKEDGYIKANSKNFSFKKATYKDANCASTRGLFIRYSDFKEIGGFLPKKLPHYLSDYEFTIRACRMGLRILCDDNLKLYFDSQESGFHTITHNSFREFLSKYFSKKNPGNPIYQLRFIRLTSPNQATCIFISSKVVYVAIKKLVKALIIRSNKKEIY